MPHPPRFLAFVAVLLAPVAIAQHHHHRPIRKAVQALQDAASIAQRGGPRCRVAVLDTLNRLIDQVDALKAQSHPRNVALLKFEVSNAGSSAAWSGCPEGVVLAIHRASDYLDAVRLAMPHPQPPATTMKTMKMMKMMMSAGSRR